VFIDLDPLEEYLKKPVTEMTPEDLITYIKTYMSTVHGLELVVDPTIPRERSTFKGLKNTYGDNAGLIVKWVLWKYQGKYSGEYINYFSFVKGRKWWTDLMYQELQLQVQKEQKKLSKKNWAGFATRP